MEAPDPASLCAHVTSHVAVNGKAKKQVRYQMVLDLKAIVCVWCKRYKIQQQGLSGGTAGNASSAQSTTPSSAACARIHSTVAVAMESWSTAAKYKQ